MASIVWNEFINELWVTFTKRYGSKQRTSHYVVVVEEMLKRKDRWYTLGDVEKVVYNLLPHVYTNGWELLKTFNRRTEVLFRKPKADSTGEMGFDHADRTEVVALLILLEASGFGIDPAPFVELMLPEVQKKKLLTDADLRILWYKKERHGCEAYTFSTSKESHPVIMGHENILRQDGYFAACRLDKERKKILTITTTPPKKARGIPSMFREGWSPVALPQADMTSEQVAWLREREASWFWNSKNQTCRLRNKDTAFEFKMRFR